MINWIEFKLGCRGLLHLARFDPQFPRFFDRSAAGARRSFSIAAILLPFYLLQFWLEIDKSVPSAGIYLTARTLGYAYSWILFPIVILLVGRLLQRDAESVGCITIYNWVSFIWIVFQIPVLLLLAIDPNSGLASGIYLISLLLSVLIEGFLFVHCLRIPYWQAAILVLIDLALSFYLIGPVSRALGCAPF
jgi:hypothetical protein